MEWVPRFHEFRNAVRYKELRHALTVAGIASVGFGVIAFATSVRDMGENVAYTFMALVALGLVLDGIWIMTTDRTTGFVSDGVLLVTTGLLNLVLMMASLRTDGVAFRPLLLATAGTWQVIWGYRNFGHYRDYVLFPVTRPGPGVNEDIALLARHVASLDFAADPAVLAFRDRASPWQAWLCGDKAVFARSRGTRVFFVEPPEARFQETRRRPDGDSLGSFVLGQTRIPAVIPQEALSRFDDWKQGRLKPNAKTPPGKPPHALEPVAGTV